MKFKGLIVAVLALALIKPVTVQAEELTVVDKGYLMLIAQAEAEGEGIEGKAAVMRVVLNRVASEKFPNTVGEVLFQKGQFSTVNPGGRIYKVQPDAECVAAVTLIENGWNGVPEALYFNNSSNVSGKFFCKLGNHYFGK